MGLIFKDVMLWKQDWTMNVQILISLSNHECNYVNVHFKGLYAYRGKLYEEI